MLLDYVAFHCDTKLRFHASDIILHIDTDVAYHVLPKAKICIVAYFFLSTNPSPPPTWPTPKQNATIFVEYKTLRNVVASAAKFGCGGLFHNIQVKIPTKNHSLTLAISNHQYLSKRAIPQLQNLLIIHKSQEVQIMVHAL